MQKFVMILSVAFMLAAAPLVHAQQSDDTNKSAKVVAKAKFVDLKTLYEEGCS